MKDEGFEIVAAAQDTGGWAAAGPWYERAGATFTTLVDPRHTITALYGMVNVPTGVWVDEEGRIVRPGEVAYSKDFSFANEFVNGSDYAAALRDWVRKGAASEYAMTPEEIRERAPGSGDDAARAEVNFRLGVFFHERGDADRAKSYMERAQALAPENWNYHRQEWSLRPGGAGGAWTIKYRALDGKPYYAPLRLKKK